MLKRINKKRIKIRGYYTSCPECGRMMDSDEYLMYGKCYNCRW